MVSPVEESAGEELREGEGVPVETIDVEEGGTGDAMSPLEGQNKKQKAEEFSHASTRHWKQHFMLLEEHHYSAKGVKGHRLGHCKFCFQASMEPTIEQSELIMKSFGGRAPKAPAKMQIYKKICKVHLSKCQWLPRKLKVVWQVSRTQPKALTLTKPLKNPPKAAAAGMSHSSATEASVASSLMDIRTFTIKRGLTPLEIPAFQKLIFNLIIDTQSPFTFAEEPTLWDLVEFLRPGSAEHLPSR